MDNIFIKTLLFLYKLIKNDEWNMINTIRNDKTSIKALNPVEKKSSEDSKEVKEGNFQGRTVKIKKAGKMTVFFQKVLIKINFQTIKAKMSRVQSVIKNSAVVMGVGLSIPILLMKKGILRLRAKFRDFNTAKKLRSAEKAKRKNSLPKKKIEKVLVEKKDLVTLKKNSNMKKSELNSSKKEVKMFIQTYLEKREKHNSFKSSKTANELYMETQRENELRDMKREIDRHPECKKTLDRVIKSRSKNSSNLVLKLKMEKAKHALRKSSKRISLRKIQKCIGEKKKELDSVQNSGEENKKRQGTRLSYELKQLEKEEMLLKKACFSEVVKEIRKNS